MDCSQTCWAFDSREIDLDLLHQAIRGWAFDFLFDVQSFLNMFEHVRWLQKINWVTAGNQKHPPPANSIGWFSHQLSSSLKDSAGGRMSAHRSLSRNWRHKWRQCRLKSRDTGDDLREDKDGQTMINRIIFDAPGCFWAHYLSKVHLQSISGIGTQEPIMSSETSGATEGTRTNTTCTPVFDPIPIEVMLTKAKISIDIHWSYWHPAVKLP